MATKEVRVLSYFSIDTNLAGEFGDWPEFVEGEGYDVRLESATVRNA